MSWKINAIPFQLYDEEQQIHLIHLCRKKGPKGSCSLLLLCASFPVNRSTPFLKVRILTSFFTNVTDAIVIRFQRNLLFFLAVSEMYQLQCNTLLMYPSITKKVGVGVISTKLWLLLLDFLNKNALTLRPYLFSVKSLKSVLNYMLRIGNVVRSQKLCAENHGKKLFIFTTTAKQLE